MERHVIKISGAIVYWSAGPTSREHLERRMRAVGLGDDIPGPRTEAACLKAAMSSYCDGLKAMKDQEYLVHPHKKFKENGFEAVRVVRSEVNNEYEHVFSARMSGNRVSVFAGNADQWTLQELFDAEMSTLTGSAIGQMLVGMLGQMNGVALRPSGGVYWIPEGSIERWREIASIVEACGSEKKDGSSVNRVYVVQTAMNDETARAVKDAIVSEVSAAVVSVQEEVFSGLGEVAGANRKRVMLALHDKVRQYEGILAEGLESLHAAIGAVEASFTTAALGDVSIPSMG